MWYNRVCFVFVFCCNGSIEGVVLCFALFCCLCSSSLVVVVVVVLWLCLCFVVMDLLKALCCLVFCVVLLFVFL